MSTVKRNTKISLVIIHLKKPRKTDFNNSDGINSETFKNRQKNFGESLSKGGSF